MGVTDRSTNFTSSKEPRPAHSGCAVRAANAVSDCYGLNSSLLLVYAFLWKMTAVESRSVLQAKQWIQRIVVGTIGVELAGTLVHVLTGSIPR